MSGRDPYQDFADQHKRSLRAHTADQPHHNARFLVKRTRPKIVAEQLKGGDEVIREGDPDVEFTQHVKAYDKTHGIERGDILIATEDDDGWTVKQVKSKKVPKALATEEQVQQIANQIDGIEQIIDNQNPGPDPARIDWRITVAEGVD